MSTQFRPEQADLTKYWDFGSGTMRVPAGTSFPAGPGDGDTYYRTDEDLLYIYDGAGWARIQNQAVDVAVEQVGSPTYEDVQDWINTTQSAGLIDGGAITATSYAIHEADDAGETFKIVGDVTAYFADGVEFTVSGSTGNDGDYTTVGDSTYDDTNTTITVADVPDGTNDGDIADGRVDVALGKGMIRTTDDAIDGVTSFFDWPANAKIALTDNSVNWIYATYGSGTPAVASTDTYTDIDHTTECTIGRIYREGTTAHILKSGTHIYDAFRRGHRRIRELRRVERASGAIISNEGTLKIKVTAAVLYSGIDRLTTSEVDTSGVGRFRAWYHTGAGGWTSTGYPADQTDIDSANYDTGTGLAALAGARYGVYWVFLDFDSHLHVVYGTTSYKLHEAQAAEVPAAPPICNEFSVLVARIIAYKDAPEITEAASAFVTVFHVTTAASHKDLADLEIVTGGHTLAGAQWSLVGATALNTIGLLVALDDVSGPAEAVLKSNATGDLTLHDLTATGQLSAGAGIAEGLILGADAQWYRSVANMLRTPDSVTIDVGLNVGAPDVAAVAGGLNITDHGRIYRKSANNWGRGWNTYKRGAAAGDTNAIVATAELGFNSFYGWDGAAYARGAYLICEATENWDGVSHGAEFGIWTTPNGSVVLAERLIVGQDGLVTVKQSLKVDAGLNVGAATGAAPGDIWGVSAVFLKPRWELKNIHGGAGSASLYFIKDGGSPADDDYIGAIPFVGKNSVDGDITYAAIYVLSTDVTDTTEDGQILFYTRAAGVWTGTAWFESGKVYNAANSVDWDVVSDETLKHQITPISKALVSLDNLEPIAFQFNERYRDINPTADLSQIHAGFTAQNFAKVFPEQISYVGKYKSMNTGGLSALLVAGVQELNGCRLIAAIEREAIREQIGVLENQLALLNQAAQRGTQ